jgi:hypothetical protein
LKSRVKPNPYDVQQKFEFSNGNLAISTLSFFTTLEQPNPVPASVYPSNSRSSGANGFEVEFTNRAFRQKYSVGVQHSRLGKLHLKSHSIKICIHQRRSGVSVQLPRAIVDKRTSTLESRAICRCATKLRNIDRKFVGWLCSKAFRICERLLECLNSDS